MDIAGTGYITSYAYNLANHTVTITQGSQLRTNQTDEAGRPVSVTEPERGITSYSYTYNSTGLQVVRARPKANQTNASVLTHTTTQYDSLGRVVSISYDDGITPAKNYYYDTVPSSLQWSQAASNPKGMLVATSSGSGTSLTRNEMSYDISGNVLSMWQCAPSICGGSSQQSRPLQLSYDLGGNLTGETDLVIGGVTYGRTPAGEVSSVTTTSTGPYNPPNLASNVVNTPFGPTSYALGNGLNQVSSYDTLGRNNGVYICNGSLLVNCANGTELYGASTSYKGSQVPIGCDTVLDQCQSNGYDEFNRLTSITDYTNFTGDIGSYIYTYDRYGNRLSQTSQSGGPSPVYSFPNGNNNQIQGAGYDAAGNETSDNFHSYSYDAEGNVLQVDLGSTAQYVYDASNRRVRVQTSSATNEYVFDPFGQRISTWVTSSNFGREGSIYMNGEQIAYHAFDGTTYFQHRNLLGTVRIRTNYLGQTSATESSLPYGDRFQQTGSVNGPAQDIDEYAGQDNDSESGTSHAQFRQYSSTQGRWMSPDPYDGSYDTLNPQSLNRYTYALNSPLFATDPSGLNGDGDCDDPDSDCDGSNGGGSGDSGEPGEPGYLGDPSGGLFGNTPDPYGPQNSTLFRLQGQGTTAYSTPFDWTTVDPSLWSSVLSPMQFAVNNGPTTRLGRGGAPNNNQQKSPKRQACEQAAANQLNASAQNLNQTLVPNMLKSAKVGLVLGAAVGCGVGAFATSPTGPGAAVGCGIGAADGAVNGYFGGMASSVATTIWDGISAINTYKNQLAVCATE
jgi:RHS repeat-associated protein